MITDRNLKSGTRLTATYKGQNYLAIPQTDGRYCLTEMPPLPEGDWQVFKSLSAAAMAITGNSVNGWRFWTVEDPLAGADIPGPEAFLDPGYGQDVEKAHRLLAEQAEKPAKNKGGRPRRFRLITVVKEDPSGLTLWCAACQASFRRLGGAAIPLECPNGHRSDDTELTDSFVPDENLVALSREVTNLAESTIA